MDRSVTIGAAPAGTGVAEERRRLGFAGTITVLGDEPHLPYQRPPLSKELLHEGGTSPNLYLYPRGWYDDNAITLDLGRKVLSIDRQAQIVAAESGAPVSYDHLVIATGARPRPLGIAGLEGAITLRTLDDAQAVAGNCGAWKRAAVVGGGFIGLEVASYLRMQQVDVSIIEAAPQLMGRVVSKATARFFAAHHRAAGTRVLLSQTVEAGRRVGDRWEVTLAGGDMIEADAVISAVGALANTQLAIECGLAVQRGILVDELMRTSDPAISAVGDCAEHVDPVYGCRVRLESVQNATDQGKALAAHLMGEGSAYASVPWFWSTQGSAKLQIAGLALGETEDVVRPAYPESGRLAVFRYIGDRLAAVETVNLPGDHLLARRLLANGVAVPKEAAADPNFNLRSLL